MNRRAFMRSLGGAVAAALVPFVWPMRKDIGVRAILGSCDRVLEYKELDLKALNDLVYQVARNRKGLDTIDIYTDQRGKEWLEQKAFVEMFFFNKPIA